MRNGRGGDLKHDAAPYPLASSEVEMPIVCVCPPGVSTSLDTNGIRRSSKRIAPPRRIVRPRHRRPLRIDADADGKDAGVGDEHIGRFVDAVIGGEAWRERVGEEENIVGV